MSNITNSILLDGKKFFGTSLEQIQPKTKLLTSLFKDKQVIVDEIIQLDKKVVKNEIVSYVNPDMEAKSSSIEGFTTDLFKLPTIKDMKHITRQMLMMRGFGYHNYDSSVSNKKQLVDMITDIQKKQIELFNTKVELGAIDAYFNGKLSVIGEGENRELLFNRDSSLTRVLTGNAVWGGSTANISSNISSWITLLNNQGSNPTHLIARSEIIDLMFEDSKVKEEIKTDSGLNFGYGDYNYFGDGVTFRGIYKNIILLAYSGVYTDELGSTQQAVPADKVVLLDENNSNQEYFGNNNQDLFLTDDDFKKTNRNFYSYFDRTSTFQLGLGAFQTRACIMNDANSSLVATVL
tara:strand:+ start:3219 stop:4265 length:1047 start_codon:yes stop_codon:yes gene_type:complete